MRKNGEGRIVQNSSVLGFAAMKYRGAYNASKFAIEGWTDTLRLELYGTDIKIALLEPGPIETQFRQNALQAFKKWINIENSVHSQSYIEQLQRLEKEQSSKQFVLPPESCIKPLLHALDPQSLKIATESRLQPKYLPFLKGSYLVVGLILCYEKLHKSAKLQLSNNQIEALRYKK